MIHAARVIGFALLLTVSSLPAVAEEFTDALHAYLQQAVEVEKRAVGIVVGIVDEHGSRVVSCGRLDNDTEQEVDGDTVFEIGSVGKTFTVLLLQDMIERGEMKLDDPVAKYLPLSVKMPTRNGKEITLHHLATHTSGLPGIPDNLDSRRADNPYADYTVAKLYAFLSACELTRDPGTQPQYSNLGMGLLGHAVTLKAGTDYEALVVERICRPLDAVIGQYELAPSGKSRTAGKLMVWREGDRLVGQVFAKDALQGAFDIYPESETNFFLKLDGSQLSFIKNGQGQVTRVIHHSAHPGVPDGRGEKVR